MTERREVVWVVALFVAALALRFAMTAHWVYAGSDSYGYMRLSDELRHDHRLALGPDQPLQWARLPLYPVFLTLKGEAATAMDWRGDQEKGPGWLRISRAQTFVDLILMVALVWWMARRLGGPRVGLVALGLAAFSPFTTPFVGAVLTETWAIALSTAAMAPLILFADRPRRAFALSGAFIGLGMLLRADALFLCAAFVPALYYLCKSWKERVVCGALAAVIALGIFSPWPIRNLVQFGEPHAIGARIDRDSRPLENVDGYWAWLRSFARHWNATTYAWTCYYERSSSCQSVLPDLVALHAFDSPAEKVEVMQLLKRREKEGLTPAIDGAFAQLASRRHREQPIWVNVMLPLLRAGNMWVTWQEETLGNPAWRPLQPVSDWIADATFPLTMIQFLLICLSGAFLLTRPERRIFAAIFLTTMAARTLILAWTAYCMPRYATEMMPLGWILIVVAGKDALTIYRQRARS